MFLKSIGEGASGSVQLVYEKKGGKFYAMK